MKLRKNRTDAVSPVIAVILMVAITVVLAGVLYVWVSTLSSDADSEVVLYQLTVKDAAFNKDNRGDLFAVDEIVVRVEQTGGEPIRWIGHTVYLERGNTSEKAEILPATIETVAYDVDSNGLSRTGEIVEFKVTTEIFRSGDMVELSIIFDNDVRYRSPGNIQIF